jgi:hypothetical protein
MFETSHITLLHAARSQARAFEAWREAASLVGIRWQAYIEADSLSRPSAFASYVDALDAEEVAAFEMATLSPSIVPA